MDSSDAQIGNVANEDGMEQKFVSPRPDLDDDEEKNLINRQGDDESLFFRDDYHKEGLKRFPEFPYVFGGVVDDYQRRLPYFKSDMIDDAFNRKTPAAALMMFLATFCSTVALGSAISRATNGQIGISEYLLMNGIAGITHAILGCQPLLILRPTGPITLMLTQLYSLSLTVSCDFFTLVAWTGIGIGIWMTIIAATEFSRHVAMLTTFAHDVFAVFVSSIYVVDGVTGVVGRFINASSGETASPVFALTITVWLIFVAFSLTALRSARHLLPASLRYTLADYALGIATITGTCLSFAYGSAVAVDRLEVISGVTGPVGWHTATTTSGRDWVIPIFTSPNAGIAFILGMVVSIPITIFFYFDQNFSSLLCQTESMELSKGSYYHSSFLWMGIFNFVMPIFGFPFVTGSLPHSPQMVRALHLDEAQIEELRAAGGPSDKKVAENRIAPFLMYLSILLCAIVFAGIVELIPVAAADAVLIFVGLEGIFDTRLWRRLPVLVTPSEDVDPDHGNAWAARKFTLLQLAVVGAGWGLNETPIALAFPLVIASLVPIRFYVLPIMFTKEELQILDAEDEKVKANVPQEVHQE
ncbi:hypothetical protein AAMO2058_000227500 [Amorphochlora amoebiformis]